MIYCRSVMFNKKIVKIDGSFGEGGGQIIRTALALSMITQTPIEIFNIRAKRKKSGLMRQHLACVQASQHISQALVTGAELGSSNLSFSPQNICAGNYDFNIGSAGSTSLVLQTILPALLYAQQPSTIKISGGTHNPLAPTTDFLKYSFFPTLTKMGIFVDYQLHQAGFAPIGGGQIIAKIQPISTKNPIKPNFHLIKKEQLLGIDIFASELNLNIDIIKREIASCKQHILQHNDISEHLLHDEIRSLKGIGEGNTCVAIIKQQTPLFLHQEVFTILGEKRKSAEQVGRHLADLVNQYLQSNACVDEYLTDQLLLPLALTGGGQFTSRYISEHTRTQAVMIEKFLPVHICIKQIERNHFLVLVKNI